MAKQNLVPVMRCPVCGHLIPKNRQTCPYCSNAEVKVPTVPQGPKSSSAASNVSQASQPTQSPVQKPTPKQMNKGVRKGLIIGGSLVVAAILGVLVWRLVSDARVLKQSILEPLTQKQLEANSKNHPQLIEYADLFRQMRDEVIGTPEEATYRAITYEQMIDYLDFLSSDTEREKLQNKALTAYADYRKPYDVKFQTEADRWTTFYNEHDPSAYLDLTFHTRYESEEDYYYTNYYPAFWVEIAYPKGAIKDCEVFFGLWSDNYQEWHYDATAMLSLKELRECKESANYYFQHVSSTSPDIYDYYSLRYEIRSVTLSDGTIISTSGREEIPHEMLQYIEDPTPEYKDEAISAVVDSNFQGQEEYVDSYTEKYMEQKDKLCFDLISKVLP